MRHPIKQNFFLKKSKILPFVELRMANRSNACYHTHSHDEFSFGVIDEGEAVYRNQRQKYHISKGTTVTINPGDAHSCNPKSGDWSYRMLFVNTRWIGKLQQEMMHSNAQDYLPFINHLQNEPHFYHAFSLLFNRLFDETNPLSVETELVEFIDKCFANGYKKYVVPTDLHKIIKAKELIMDQLEKNLTLDQFSECTSLSRYHLIRSFKQAYGQSPHAFQLDQRIIKAKSLLQRGHSITDTANQLGFSDQSHFQRNFKKRMAITPGQYQSFY